MATTPFSDKAVKAVYDAFPKRERTILHALRELIFTCATKTKGVGKIEETLKWGEPSYLTIKPKSGTTIRLSMSKTGCAAIFVHCQTTLISEFQALFPDEFTYDGNRAVYIEELTEYAANKLRLLIRQALTYHLN